MADPTPSVQSYDHEVANVNLRAEIVAMHRVIESQRHRISQAEALAETLREDLADATKAAPPAAAPRAGGGGAMIQRYDIDTSHDCDDRGEIRMTKDSRGDYITFEDHESEVAALRAEVERLRHATNCARSYIAIDGDERDANMLAALDAALEAPRG